MGISYENPEYSNKNGVPLGAGPNLARFLLCNLPRVVVPL
jgi:hypothetical protein